MTKVDSGVVSIDLCQKIDTKLKTELESTDDGVNHKEVNKKVTLEDITKYTFDLVTGK